MKTLWHYFCLVVSFLYYSANYENLGQYLYGARVSIVSVKTPVMKLTAEYGSKLTYLYVETLLDGQSRAICNN